MEQVPEVLKYAIGVLLGGAFGVYKWISEKGKRKAEVGKTDAETVKMNIETSTSLLKDAKDMRDEMKLLISDLKKDNEALKKKPLMQSPNGRSAGSLLSN